MIDLKLIIEKPEEVKKALKKKLGEVDEHLFYLL